MHFLQVFADGVLLLLKLQVAEAFGVMVWRAGLRFGLGLDRFCLHSVDFVG